MADKRQVHEFFCTQVVIDQTTKHHRYRKTKECHPVDPAKLLVGQIKTAGEIIVDAGANRESHSRNNQCDTDCIKDSGWINCCTHRVYLIFYETIDIVCVNY